jgi:hypothetical protein
MSPSLEIPQPFSTQYLNEIPSQATRLPAMPVITPPAITQNGLTLQPILVTFTNPETEHDGTSAVSKVVGYQYVVDSVTLALDDPTTINDVLLAVTTLIRSYSPDSRRDNHYTAYNHSKLSYDTAEFGTSSCYPHNNDRH